MAGQVSSSSRPNQIRDDGNDQAEYLSLGFELEVIFATLKPELEDKEMFDGAIWRGTPEEFDSDSDSDSDSELDPEEFESWLIKHLEDNMPGESFRSWRSSESINGYDTWRTKKTGTADYDTGTTYGHRPATTQYDWKSREIASPILNTKDNQWAQQVHDICRAIRKARIHLNESTTVSVHVGRGREIFCLLEMQKFITLLWCKCSGGTINIFTIRAASMILSNSAHSACFVLGVHRLPVAVALGITHFLPSFRGFPSLHSRLYRV